MVLFSFDYCRLTMQYISSPSFYTAETTIQHSSCSGNKTSSCWMPSLLDAIGT